MMKDSMCHHNARGGCCCWDKKYFCIQLIKKETHYIEIPPDLYYFHVVDKWFMAVSAELCNINNGQRWSTAAVYHRVPLLIIDQTSADQTHTHLWRRRAWRAAPSRWGDGSHRRGSGPEVDSESPASGQSLTCEGRPASAARRRQIDGGKHM